MPSPNSLHSPTPSASPRQSLLQTIPDNGNSETSTETLRNGVGQNGDVSNLPSEGPIQERKQQAKAVMAASGIAIALERSPNTASEASQTRDRQPLLSNGTVQTRKRSRSGTPIRRSTNRDRTLRPRGTNDPKAEAFERIELSEYVHHEHSHIHALNKQCLETIHLHEYKEQEKDQWMKLRGIPIDRDIKARNDYEKRQHGPDDQKQERPPWLNLPVSALLDPAAIFGPGYGQYGNMANGTTQIARSQVKYPSSRRRAGGRVTRELRVLRKDLAMQSEQLDELVPIRLDIEWGKIRLRDTFTWNLHDRVVPYDLFAQQLVEDFNLPLDQYGPLVQKVSQELQEQVQDFYPHVFIEEEALDPHLPYTAYKDDEMRITIKLNITIGQHTLVDQFEWEINNPLNSPEVFAQQMTQDLSLAGEFTTAIAHSIREQSQLFTRSLYVTGHAFDGRPVEDQELKASFLPSPMPSPFRPYQAAKEFTPYLYELNDVELEKTELSLSREERRQKRSVNRRGGPALPDLKDRRRTIRTLVVSSVLPGAAETLDDSRIFKRTVAASGKGRRPGFGHKDGIDDSDETDSEESAPDSPAIPAHLLAGTARTRGMRGAASVAQAAMRGNFARSATPESSILHHHETRTSGRRFVSRDYREESIDDLPPTLKITLHLPRERFKQLLRDQKLRSRPTPLDQTSHRRSLSTTPGQGTPAPGTMGPPTTPAPPQQQSNLSRPQSSPGEHKDGANSLHPQAAQLGRVDALGPPSLEYPIPSPPTWLRQALSKLQESYPDDLFDGTMRYTAVSTTNDTPVSIRPSEPTPPDTKFMYYPRIKCLDCPGKLYTPGPDTGVTNFEVHLKNRVHRQQVEQRISENRGGSRSRG